ncbi:MAG: hypothetical protein JNK82_17120 [Myxococcaceae bacterium]|nr:hypothetical protein [Myxococcaceae bacterium]
MLVTEAVGSALESMIPHSALKSVVSTLELPPHAEVGTLDVATTRRVLEQLSVGLKLYTGRAAGPQVDVLRKVVTGSQRPVPTRLELPVLGEGDVLVSVKACQRLCSGFFSATDCVRLATVVSELSRNIYMYAREGLVTLQLAEDERGVVLTISAFDRGPGLDVEAVMAKGYQSKTGLGRGLKGCRDILDSFEVTSQPGKTLITGTKRVRR